MTRKLDLLQDCNDQRIPVTDFKATFCARCRNNQCVNAQWAGSRWSQRMLTQEDRLLLNPNFAHEKDPKFEHIRGLHFRSLSQDEIVLNARDPWAGPGVHLATPDMKTVRSDTVDLALAALGGKALDSQPVSTPTIPLPVPVKTQSSPEVKPAGLAMNVPYVDTGVMLDGSQPSEKGKAVGEVDPWAPQPPKPKVVPVGAKIKMGI